MVNSNLTLSEILTIAVVILIVFALAFREKPPEEEGSDAEESPGDGES